MKNRIKAKMAKHKVKKEAVASSCECSVSTVENWMGNKTQPSIIQAHQIMVLMGDYDINNYLKG